MLTQCADQVPLVTLAQITDTHLLADSQACLRGCSPYRNLEKIVERLSALAIDALLLTGDLAEAGEPEAYQQLLTLLSPLSIPIYWLGGNHDCLHSAQQILSPHYPGVTDQLTNQLRSFFLGNWHLILLNSVLPTAQWGEGYVSERTLDDLDQRLTREHDRPTLLALHHHPLPVGIDWLDQIAVTNGASLLRKIDRFPNVKIIVFGHIHWDFQQRRGSQVFYGCPATSTQVMPPHPLPQIQVPGFRILTLWPDGSHQSHIDRLEI